MGIRTWAFSSVVAGSLLGFGAAEARAVDPVVLGVGEAVAAEGNGRVILVYGAGVSKIKTYTLNEDNGPVVSPLTILFKTKTLVALQYPPNLTSPTYTLPGNYDLAYTFGTSGVGTVGVRLTGGFTEAAVVGASALTAPLLADLNDADTVGGESAAQFHDWGLLTGVPSGFMDGIDDGATYLAGNGLLLSGATFSVSFSGTGSAITASRSDHDHDLRYYTQSQLNAAGGTVNGVGNPVDWSRLKGMPAGFADGVDDGGAAATYSAGTGLSLVGTVFSVNFAGTGSATTASKSDHDHDLRYYTQTQLNASGGTLNNAGNPVDWSRLKGVPAGFADGVDTDTTYTAGTGLALNTGAFSVSFSGSGAAGTASRSDHNHSTTYLDLTGGTLSGTLTISNSSGQAISATSGSTSQTTGGIDCTTSGGVGVAGHGDIGVLGDLDSSGTNGVEGRCAYSYQNGMYAYANSGYGDNTSTALFAYHFWGGPAVVGKSYSGIGVYGYSVYGKSGVGVMAVNQSYGTALLVNHTGSSGNLAIFQTYGTNYARIDRYGTGYFNGGTQTSGADFAESVKVDRPKAEFEPGDVLVIDVKAPRQFALSREAESPLVAGVVSTKPALVGTTHDVARSTAGGLPAWRREEVLLGVVGIVPTKVCDEGGPIRIGDLLVTSSVPGYAKRGPPSPAVGTVIGKALGALDRGKGKVEVLLMAR